MLVVRTPWSLLALLAVAASLALPSLALGQSAGDEQYTDPFGEEAPASQEQNPPPEQPVEQPAEQPSGAPEPAPGGNGTAEPAPAAEAEAGAEAAQGSSPTLPRTGAPALLVAVIGYALLLAGVAIRRTA
jgi:hypothetical protein